MKKKKLRLVNYKKPNKIKYLVKFLFSPISTLINVIKLFIYYYVNFVFGRSYATIGKNSNVHPTVILRHPSNIIIGHDCLINHNNVLQSGKLDAKIIIGNYVQTGPNVMMFAYNHGIELNNVPMINQPYYESDIIIEDDVWIGAGTVITAGVKIGKGSVIGSNSTVTKDIPEFSIAVGSPAKVIKSR